MSKILGHTGKGNKSVFKVLWKTRDESWLPYSQISHLDAIQEYCEALRIKSIHELIDGETDVPEDPQVSINFIMPERIQNPETYKAVKEPRRVQHNYPLTMNPVPGLRLVIW